MYLQQADLLVSPRIEGENTPMKIYSYMDSGTPLVATRIRSHTQVLDESTALLADVEPKSMADVLKKGLQRKEEASKRASAAKDMVESNFSRNAFREKITSYYSKLAHVWDLRD